MRRTIIFCFLLISFTIWSQEPNQEFHFFNIKEGIPKVGISNIIQDHYGFIWISTTGTGLYKFDGIDYINYKHKLNDSTSLSSSRIQYSFMDSKKRLWFGTENGLNLYHRDLDQFNRIVLDSTNINNEFILSIEEDGLNNMLIGTNGFGMYKINTETLKVDKIANSTLSENGLQINITSIKHSKQGKTFVGTNLGLKELDLINNKLIETRILTSDKKTFNTPIETLFIDSKNNLWIGSQTDEGVFKCELSKDSNSLIIDIKHFHFSSKKIMDFDELSNGTLIIGTENDGLFHIQDNGQIIKNYRANKSEENNILHNSIWTLFIDDRDRLWLGYYNSGVAVSDNLYNKFMNIKSLPNNDNSLKIGSVMGMIKENTNKLWIATDGGGIDIYNTKTAKITHINSSDNKVYSGLTSDYIETIFKDSHQNIWAGSWDSGLFFLKKGDKKFKNYSIENTSGALASNTIMSLSEDSNGIIWIGTYFQGLHAFNPKTKAFKQYNTETLASLDLSRLDITKVLVDSEDYIWLGTPHGLFKVKKQKDESIKVTSFTYEMTKAYNNPSNANYILSIYESTNKDIWIGTRGAGLCRYNKATNTFTWFNKSNGLMEENVAAIIEDHSNLWISGNSGLTKFNLETMKFTNYTSNDGLVSNDYNFDSVLKDDDGIIYFGNLKGVDFFNPKHVNTNTNPPSLRLTELKLFNKKVIPGTHDAPLNKVISETDHITLNDNQTVFTIEYTGINYTRPEKNNYAYYLEGYENTWNYVDQQRSATYTNLDHGDYTFKLMASNNDGVWNQKPLELKISILPPWWKTKWALFSYLTLFFVGIYILNRLTLNRIKEKELLRVERLNQNQNDELNQKKIQFFTNISHEFRTPLTLIINPLKDIINDSDLNLPQKIKNKHAIIYKNTDKLYRLINELMDLRKLEVNKMNVRAQKINLIDFTKNIADYFQEEATRKNIYLSVDADVPDLTVWADAKMLDKILFNLLSNAIKITPEGGTITIELASTDQLHLLPLINETTPVEAVEITVSDTGPGMDSSQVEKIFERFYQIEDQNRTYFGGTGIGLEVVQSFVKLHKGKIEVKSEIGEGTVFKILLPTGHAHYQEDDLITSEESLYINKKDFLTLPNIEVEEHINETLKIQKKDTILIVEDNVELKDYLKTELSEQYKILLASNGTEGVKIAQESFPDLIITDVIMPEMNGFEFCKIIKSNASTSHIPLLMLTAKASIENRIEGIETGADAYMVKPFDLKLLKIRLSQLIKSRQLIFDKYFRAISGAEANQNASSIDKEFIQKLLGYINNNISDTNLSVEVLADQLNLSRSQLYRKIKALTGQTVNEFIRKIRLERAKQILENGSTTVSEACYKVGFASPSYFAKCFKAHFGLLPTEIETKKDF